MKGIDIKASMNEITQELENYRRLTALDNHNRETTCYHDVIKSKSAIHVNNGRNTASDIWVDN